MQSKDFIMPTTGMLVVGDAPMILYNQYDPDQYWFPFMSGTLFVPSPPPQRPPLCNRTVWTGEKHARVPKECRELFHYERGVEQRTLPFHEHRYVTKKNATRLNDTNFPGWEKTSDGNPLRIIFAEGRKLEVETYCREHARSRFAISKRSVVLEDHRDAAFVRMMFGV